MRINLKVIVLMMFLFSRLVAEEATNEEYKRGASMIQAPLQSELTEVYRGSEKVGKKAGKSTKNFFCTVLNWDFFCKGDD
jgi:hypothetical protein